MTCGVIYVAWGEKARAEAEQSVATLPDGLDHRIVEPDEPDIGHGAKICMYRKSPFDLTLFLDNDTQAITDDLSFGFEKAEKHGLALCHAPASDARLQNGDERLPPIQWNSGVIFFAKSFEMADLFHAWRVSYQALGCRRDQPALAASIEARDVNPYVLPREWNFRADFEAGGYGPVKIWHSRMDVPDELRRANGFWRIGGR